MVPTFTVANCFDFYFCRKETKSEQKWLIYSGSRQPENASLERIEQLVTHNRFFRTSWPTQQQEYEYMLHKLNFAASAGHALLKRLLLA